MGPIALFDKSFLQSLSLDEAVWFDQFFLTNISPLFFVETLADLEKAVRIGRTPEQEVRIIADKTPEMHSYPNMFHGKLCINNLLGYDVPMENRIILDKGKPFKTADQSGVFFEVTPEAEALSRWQKGEFLEVERLFAKAWRRSLTLLDFKYVIEALDSIGFAQTDSKTLEEAKAKAENIVNLSGFSFSRFKLFLSILNLPEHLYLSIYLRWTRRGCPSFFRFAPYAAYVLSVEIFFYIAVFSGLISEKKVTNKIDLAYLYYLPFCLIFISSDNFHRRCAPLFLKKNQDFVWGPDLKNDLKKIDEYYCNFPEIEREQGLTAIANRPPSGFECLISNLWDHHFSNWRSFPEKYPPRKIGENDKFLKNMMDVTKLKPLEQKEIDFGLSDPESVLFQRKILKRKGKWWQLPKDLKEHNNE